MSSRWDARDRRVLAWSTALSGAALFLNPVGIQQVLYPLNTMLSQPINLSQVEEWKPLLFSDLRGLGFLAILGGVLLLLVLRHSELFLDELLLLAVGTELAVNHRRMMFAFGILAAPVVSRLLSTLWDGYNADQDRPALNAGLIALSVLVMVWGFPDRQNLVQQVDQGNPVKAVEFINTHPLPGRMLNDYVYGGYLIWSAPQYPVFIDGRADVFEWAGVLDEFARWATLQSDPNTLLNQYNVDFCLLDRASPMAHVLPLMQGWKTVYSDNRSVIFQRVAASNPPTMAKNRTDNGSSMAIGTSIRYSLN